MQTAIEDLVKLGPLPDQDVVEEQFLDRFGSLLDKVERPITDEEARALVRLFGPDSCFGAAWALVRIIETAPGWPLLDVLEDSSNEWIDLLKIRCRNAGLLD